MGSLYGWDVRIAINAIHDELALANLPPSRALSIIGQWAQSSQPSEPHDELLAALSQVVVQPTCTRIVVRHARPILLDLFSRAIKRLGDQQAPLWSDWQALSCLYALTLLLPGYPELQPLVAELLSSVKSDHITFQELGLEQQHLSVILLSLYRLVNVSPTTVEENSEVISSSVLLEISQSPQAYSPALRLLALRVFARLENLSEATLESLVAKNIGAPGIRGCKDTDYIDATVLIRSPLSNGAQGFVDVESVDVWILPILEARRITDLRQDVAASLSEVQQDPIASPFYQNAHPTDDIIEFGGYLFHRSSKGPVSPHTFSETSSFRSTLQDFAGKLRRGLPILLSGPEACGKSSLIRYACSKVSSDESKAPILWLQLGDQSGVDAKSLIGSFVSSTRRPGAFEWVEGALTRAVRMGKWIVLEDIDRANAEVLSVVKPLVEGMSETSAIGARPSLDLGHRGRVRAGRGFALFATRTALRSQANGKLPAHTFLGSHHWTEVEMNALSEDDVLSIATSVNGALAATQDDTVSRLVSTWSTLVNLSRNPKAFRAKSSKSLAPSSSGTQRVPSLHDLLKWCRRVDATIAKSSTNSPSAAKAPFSNQALQEEIALEAVDIFLGACSPPLVDAETNDRFSVVLDTISQQLGVEQSALWHMARDRKPEMSVHSSGTSSAKMIQIGRCQLSRYPRDDSSSLAPIVPPSSTFALTGTAARLLERLAVCVLLNEPTLIVGETGTGKTTVVQQLASIVRKPLVALNLSQQTESADLLGGFKPLDPQVVAMDLHNRWLDLFQRTFSLRRNARYLQAERKALQAQRWARLHGTWQDSVRLAFSKLSVGETNGDKMEEEESESDEESEPARKAMRTSKVGDRHTLPQEGAKEDGANDGALRQEWQRFEAQLTQFSKQHIGSKRSLVFSFVEGPLVKAIRSGAWVLLDEINLATSETLESLSTLLQSPDSSIVLSERGDIEPIVRHPEFRLFACMNPATDVGKKDLPNSLRSRFTELYAPSPDTDQEALVNIIDKYIGPESAGDRGVIVDVAHSFIQIKQLTREQKLADGANQRPHYSIRSLARALVFAKDTSASFGIRRSLYEGFVMSFTMLLDNQSGVLVRQLLKRNILDKAKNAKAAASMIPPKPSDAAKSYVQIGNFWLETGSEPLEEVPEYILTASVQEKLVGLARAALTRRSPVLIQGPTSAGKTSAVEYLARRTGHRFVRINNHEHTDLQEYLGSYSTDEQTGKLAFREGLLVQAARRGDWIVLDELNLAPSDVLEALNRLLDDNRELQIPETGEVIKPHPHFMLFATQNPPGLYAGRKVLSRAFRNRFLEIHFDDVPQSELQTILANRCQIAPSYADKIVRVFLELQRRRQQTRVFDTKQAFVTLRDLFRWGSRAAGDYHRLAINGYMLIAERTRKAEEAVMVKEVIEETLKVKMDIDQLYNVFDRDSMTSLLGQDLAFALTNALEGTGIVWTRSMQRLACLVACALRYDEPVLLVGETGTGKTSICEVVAKAFACALKTVNCHQNTDAADLLGGQRPLRNRSALKEKARATGLALLHQYDSDDAEAAGAELDSLAIRLSKIESRVDEAVRQEIRSAIQLLHQSQALFEWHDGPLVEAMRQGQHILLDEISLADDSVLERLNSVLETGRTLVLAERGGASANDAVVIKAQEDFKIVATMNPGGDYGKKELSPALRNRFTEIWVPAVRSRSDILAIIDSQWTVDSSFVDKAELEAWATRMIDFVDFYSQHLGGIDLSNVGLRDMISWARFMDTVIQRNGLTCAHAFVHGALMTLIDGLPLHPWVAAKSSRQIRAITEQMIQELLRLSGLDASNFDGPEQHIDSNSIDDTAESFAIGGFSCPKGNLTDTSAPSTPFNLVAQTPAHNALRVLRAMQVHHRAIMLEGSPGAGKTSLIVALARACRHRLTRINLSDQTELSDLFGADLPVEGGKPGEFGWRDAGFLKAMQEGEWVLLDEMNLASQSVLEGLNSCLDHRGVVYVPELGRTFSKHPNFRFFAAQNPQHQGGGRKGLPKSFLNRFTKVYIEELKHDDFMAIMQDLYPSFPADELRRIVEFNHRLQDMLTSSNKLSKSGSPWEFNLRDLLRWLQIAHCSLGFTAAERKMDPLEYIGSMYIQRFRTSSDRYQVGELARQVFQSPRLSFQQRPWFNITPSHLQVGHVLLDRRASPLPALRELHVTHFFAQQHLGALQALSECVRLAWPSILVGKGGIGKTALVRKLAQLTGQPLIEVRLNSGSDAVDIIGGFEQVDFRAEIVESLSQLAQLVDRGKQNYLASSEVDTGNQLFAVLLQMGKDIEAELTLMLQSEQAGVHWDIITRIVSDLLSEGVLSQEDQSKGHRLLDFFHETSAMSQSGFSEKGSRFAWHDGPVLTALRRGHWLLLDEANLCSASVLDRLNSLLEPGGNLALSERGVMASRQSGEAAGIEIVHPHPDFRIFIAMDPKYGELSRAMRNRGIEIYLDEIDARTMSETDTVSFAPQEASMQSVLPWSSMTEAPSQAVDFRTNADLSLLARSSSIDKTGLLSRFAADETFSFISPLLSANNQLVKVLAEAKLDFGDQSDVDRSYVSQLGLDLQTNPSLWTSHHSSSQNILSRQLQSLLRSSLALLYLKDLQHSIDLRDIASLSVLQRSALLHGGIEMDELANKDERHLCALLNIILLVSIQLPQVQAVGDDSQAAIRAADTMDVVQDCTEFLMRFWSSAKHDIVSVSGVALRKIKSQMDDLSSFYPEESISPIVDHLEHVIRSIDLRSGYAMEQVWRAFMPFQATAEGLSLAKDILSLASSARRGLPKELISNSLDIACLLAFRSGKSISSSEREELLNLGRRVHTALQQQSSHQASDSDAVEVPMVHSSDTFLISMATLSALTSSGESRSLSLARLIESDGFSASLDTALMLKGSSAVSVAAEDSVLLQRSTFGWIDLIPTASLSDNDHTNDTFASTQDIFKPSILQAVFDLALPTGRVPLSRLGYCKSAMKRMIEVVQLLSPAEMSLRQTHCIRFLARVLRTLDRPLRLALLSAEEKPTEVVKDLLIALDSATVRGIPDVLQSIMRCNGAGHRIKSIANDWHQCLVLVGKLERASEKAQDDSTAYENLFDAGGAFVVIAKRILRLYVANVPLDPFQINQAQVDLIGLRIERLEAEKSAWLSIEAKVTGNDQSRAADEVEEQIAKLRHEHDVAAAASQRYAFSSERVGRDVEDLNQMHGEMDAFVKQILPDSLVERLTRKSTASNSIGNAHLAELKATVTSISRRFSSRYAALQDLSTPFLAALSLIDLGLGMLEQADLLSSRSALTSRVEGMLSSLVEFPTSAATLHFCKQEIPIRLKPSSRMATFVVPLLLAKVKAIDFDVQQGSQLTSVFSPLAQCYDQIWHLWTLDQEQEKQRKEEEASLYRVRNLDISIEEDAELQEREFAQLFPQYKDIMEEEQSDKMLPADVNGAKGRHGFVSDEAVKQLFDLHLCLFNREVLHGSKQSAATYSDDFKHSRSSLVRRLLKANYGEMGEAMDRQSAALQVDLLCEASQNLADTQQERKRTDFYSDPAPGEAVKLQSLIHRVQSRLSALIADWPDQHVLQDIMKRCDVILRLDVTSPVNRMLAALEGLLTHTEDWQVYASSKTSLDTQREEMTAQIIEWRRMELHGWRGLLMKEQSAEFQKAKEWWFTLFQVTTKSTHDSADNRRELVALLDKFVRGSPMGQFSARLGLLKSMCTYLTLAGEHSEHGLSEDQQKVRAIVENTGAFFGQFESEIFSNLDKKRKLVEKDIQDFIKLAGWKDTNVHALKTSAQKSHRKLHQCLRKFRVILNEPVDPFLANIGSMTGVEKASDDTATATEQWQVMPDLEVLKDAGTGLQPWHTDATPGHLANVQVAGVTLQSIFSQRIRPRLQQVSTTDLLSNLSTVIIERSQELAKATPAFSSEKNEKLVKHLETRKRKAWSDLLKELRRIGFSNSKVDGLSSSSLSDSAFVFSLAGSASETVEDRHSVSEQRANNLHNRLLAMLPLLRGAIISETRNADVQGSQLQTALSFVENGFLFSLAHRLHLQDLRKSLQWFKRAFERVSALAKAKGVGAIRGTFDNAQQTLQSHLDFWTRITSGLRETIKQSGIVHQSRPESREVLESLVTVAAAHSAHIDVVSNAVQQSTCTLVSDVEQTRLSEGSSNLTRIIEGLTGLIADEPTWRSMTVPLLEFVSTSKPLSDLSFVAQQDTPSTAVSTGQKSDDLISSILVVSQDVRQHCANDEQGDEDLDDRALIKEYQKLSAYQRALRATEIKNAVQRTLDTDNASSIGQTHVFAALNRLLPFMDVYVAMLDDLIGRSSAWCLALMRLNVTLCSIITNLANKGFCKPRAPEQDQDAADDGQDDGEQIETGGVGLGEGEGAKDVTDTLKDDEEMEELQKQDDAEKQEDENGETNREKDAREMEQDFDGDIEDADQGEDEGEDQEDDDNAEIDDAVGEVDPLDLNAVDEKTWAGKDEEENQSQDNKDDKEMKGEENEKGDDAEERKGAKESSETDLGGEGAGERDQVENGKNDDKDAAEENGEDEDSGSKDQDESDAEGEEEAEGDDDDVKQDGLGRAIDQEAQQGENLDMDLDDDLEMDDADGDDDPKDGDNDSDMDEINAMSDADRNEERDEITPDPEDSEQQGEEQTEELKGDDGASLDDEAAEDEKPEVAREPGEEGAEESKDEDEMPDEQNANQQDPSSAIANPEDTFDAEAANNAASGDGEQDAPAEQQSSSRAQAGRQRRGADKQAPPVQGEESQQKQSEMDDDAKDEHEDTAGSGANRAEQATSAAEENGMDHDEEGTQQEEARSLGDALKQFRRDLDAIEERLMQQERSEQQDPGPMADDDATQVEHIQNDEESEMQALGVAQEDEVNQKNDEFAGAVDRETNDDEKNEDDNAPQVKEPDTPLNAEKDVMPLEDASSKDNETKSSGRGLMASDVRREEDADLLENVEMNDADQDEEIDDEDSAEEQDDVMAVDAEDLDAALDAFASEADEEKRLDLATSLWRLYTSETTDYAFTLSEQLRLILAPTKATKLTGDFKTGKRLNMRKIIPFIASDYVKDKIWLRRDQPLKREYQVLICIDDSKSMSDSENRSLAFKSLSLVCNALDRLEVGQVGVMKFGKNAELLKGFEGESDTVKDQQGGKIFSRLPFDQRGTNVDHLLRQSFDVLQDARQRHGQSHAGGQELWQLQIIISDGVCQDHEGLRALLRRASEARIMVVFVILDSLQQKKGKAGSAASSGSSILTMNSVEYRPDASGRPQLLMKRYLDTFPFEYFVVVQDATELPDVLSATLRQWAQRIAES